MENIIFVAIFWPPMAVYIKYGLSREFWKNVFFTLLGFYPGVIHAIRLVSQDENKKAYQ